MRFIDTWHANSITPVTFVEPGGSRSAKHQSPNAGRGAASTYNLQFPCTVDDAAVPLVTGDRTTTQLQSAHTTGAHP